MDQFKAIVDRQQLVEHEPKASMNGPSAASSQITEKVWMDLTPVGKKDFAMALAPCLTLAAGIGMDDETRREWLNAAYLALEGIPLDLLQRGAKDALKTADHPSKIVPAITKSVGAAWENRIALESRRAQTAHEVAMQIEQNRQAKLPAPGPDALGNPETTKQILDRVWPNRFKHEPDYRPEALNLDPDRPTRAPTRADYEAMGVEPETLDKLKITKGEDR